MSIAVLQEKIRKQKNPLVVDLSLMPADIPVHLKEAEESLAKAYGRFCRELLSGLKQVIPAVRLNWGIFTLLGADGTAELAKTLQFAAECGFYVILDAPELLSALGASAAAEAIFGASDSCWKCDALVISAYIGSDAVKPFLPYCKKDGKALFLVVRSPNKSAAEIQDLLTGSRLVHMAAADLVNRHGADLAGKFGYTQIAAVAAASAPDSLRALRSKYGSIFLLVDGYDLPNGNAKNCSYAFDKFGHGAAVCVGHSVTCAWKQAEADSRDYISCALQAVERAKKNLARYTTVL